MKASKVSLAYVRCASIRAELSDLGGVCREVTEDKAGILWERWLLSGRSLVLFSTPNWCEIFEPVSESNSVQETILRLREIVKKEGD